MCFLKLLSKEQRPPKVCKGIPKAHLGTAKVSFTIMEMLLCSKNATLIETQNYLFSKPLRNPKAKRFLGNHWLVLLNLWRKLFEGAVSRRRCMLELQTARFSSQVELQT